MQDRLRLGSTMLETYWFMVADRILTIIIDRWALEPEQADAVRRAFLRPNDYFLRSS